MAKPALVIAPGDTPASTSRDLRQRVRGRHVGALLGFLLGVLVPTVLAGVYLFVFALDQYHSRAAFFVRSEEFRNPLDALSAFTQVGGAAASDSSIVYDFIRSEPLVESVDRSLDLRRIYSGRTQDPVFSLDDNASKEDLVDYWKRMVEVSVDGRSGIVYLEIRAFTPDDAQEIARTVVDESHALVNELSRIAQQDAMRYAVEDVREAEERLKEVRGRIREFRALNRIIDPEAGAQTQMGVLSALHETLAEALVQRQALLEYAPENDPRINTIDRRIRALRSQIESERAIIGGHEADATGLSAVIGRYEELLVDLEFSEESYTAALAAAEQARAEARRQSRYVAVHVPPTLAEESLYPKRLELLALVGLATFIVWAVGVLIYYNARERA